MTLQNLLQEKGLTQNEVAAELNMTARNLRNKFKAPGNFTYIELKKLFKMFPEKKVISIIEENIVT